MSFVDEFNRVQYHMYKNSAAKGFHEADKLALTEEQKNSRVGLRLMLIVSELSEALEYVRKGNTPDSHIPEFTGLEAELADAVIRIMDLAETTKSRLAEAIIAKAAYNSRRPAMHGGKKF